VPAADMGKAARTSELRSHREWKGNILNPRPFSRCCHWRRGQGGKRV